MPARGRTGAMTLGDAVRADCYAAITISRHVRDWSASTLSSTLRGISIATCAEVIADRAKRTQETLGVLG